MSTVVVITPILIASWPAITAAITAALATAGYASVRQAEGVGQRGSTINRAEIELEDSEILADATGAGEEMVVEKDGITARFTRDARGALRVCVEGAGLSKTQLREIGEDLVGRVTQQYVYNRVVTEMKERDMTIVDEEVDADRTVRIRVRNW